MSVTHGEQIRTLEEHEAPGKSLAWWGMIFFIASEALIFANLIAAYLYLEIRNGNWPVPSELWFPLLNTAVLLASSFPVHWAGTSAAKGNMRNVKLGFLATIIMGAYFLGGQIYEYSGLFGKHFTPQSSVAGSAFFTLTGFHGAHVTVGLIFLLIIWLRTMRGSFSGKRHFPIEAAEMYWHFVDGVWVIVFSTVYLLPLLRG